MFRTFDKYQKWLLVLLAAFLMAVFAVPRGGCQRGPGDQIVSTFYGEPVTWTERADFSRRWQTLLVWLMTSDPEAPALVGDVEDPIERLFVLHRAGRRHGVRVGPDAVTRKLLRYPPIHINIEYVAADPAELTKNIEPTDAELKAHYDATWPDKSETFEAVKDRVRDTVKKKLAGEAALAQINQAVGALAKMPQQKRQWQTAFANVAKESGLQWGRLKRLSPDTFRAELSRRLGANAPEGISAELFRARPGVPGRVWTVGDKRVVLRVVATSAGIASDGTLFAHDEGWLNGKFTTTRTYPDHAAVIREKAQMAPGQVRRTIDEFLTVRKFVRTVCGPARGGSPTSQDAREQWAAWLGQTVTGLLVPVPVEGFVDRQEPLNPDDVQAFYERHKNIARRPDVTSFAYRQEAQVQIEYAAADLAELRRRVRVTESEIARYYEQHKTRAFLSDDGETPKLLAEVREEILEMRKAVRARQAAARALSEVARKAQDNDGGILPLASVAREAGLTYRMSRLFTANQNDARGALGELAAAPKFLATAFSEGMRPAPRRVAADKEVAVHPFSTQFESGDTMFAFRVMAYRGPHSIVYSTLSPRLEARVTRDFRHARAVDRARDAAQQIRVDIARAFLAAVAAENKLALKATAVKTAGDGAAAIPPALVRRVKDAAPGTIIPMAREGETYYTAAVANPDPETRTQTIEFVRLTPKEFTAVVPPANNAIDERARAIRDAALEKETKAEDTDDDKPKPEPTEDQVKQAEAELIEEWKRGDFEARYNEYLALRLSEVFREHFKANPLRIPRTASLDAATSGFFHIDDDFLLGGNPGIVKAAFALKKGDLSAVLTDKSAAAILHLAEEETRDERKIEFVSVDPTDPNAYDPLSVKVNEGEAAEYYEAHREEFREPARARAEFLFVSFDEVARLFKKNIPGKDVEAYFQERATTTYKDRELDRALQREIRAELARRHATSGGAQQMIAAARMAATAKPIPLAQVAAANAKLPLVSGTTPPLAADDVVVPRVGFAPALVKAITEAPDGVLSEPVLTGNGWALFRVFEKKDSRIPELKDALVGVRRAAREALLAARAEAALNKVRAYLAAHPGTSLGDALARPELAEDLPFAPSVQTTPFFDKERAAEQPFVTEALRDAVLATEPGRPTAVVKSPSVLQLARVREARKNRVVKVDYIRVDAALFSPMQTVSGEDAKAHYNAHKADYARPRRFELECLRPDSAKIKADISPDDDAVAAAYEQLLHRFPDRKNPGAYLSLQVVRNDVVGQLKTHRSRTEANDLFEEAAAVVAKDAKRPLDEIAKDLKKLRTHSVKHEPGPDAAPPLRGVPGLDAFLGAAKEGDTSPVLRTLDGPMIVRVTKVLAAGAPPFEDVEERVREDVARIRGLDMAKALAEQVRAKLASPPSLAAMQAAAADFKVDTFHVEPLGVQDTGPVSIPGLQQIARQIRYYPQMMFRYRTMNELLSLRLAEVGGPFVPGNRTDECYLAVLTRIQPPDRRMATLLGSGLAQATFRERFRQLIAELEDHYIRPGRAGTGAR